MRAAKYKGQLTNFQDIPFSADVGIVLVDSKDLRVKLLPSPHRCLEAIRTMLPVLMKQMSESLLNDVVKRLAVLASHPQDVEPFVQKVAMIESSVARLPTMKSACALFRRAVFCFVFFCVFVSAFCLTIFLSPSLFPPPLCLHLCLHRCLCLCLPVCDCNVLLCVAVQTRTV